MSVAPEEVAHVARLAELAIAEDELPALTAQMDNIVRFVAQLGELPDLDGAGTLLAGPEQSPLRPDAVKPAPLARPPADLAPEFIDGFFVVPRLGVLDEG